MTLGLALLGGDMMISLVAEVVEIFAEVEEAFLSFEFIALVGDVLSEIM